MRAVCGSLGQHAFLALIPELERPATFLPLRLDHPWQTGQTHAAIVRKLRVGAEGGGGFCETENGTAAYLRKSQGLSEGQRLQIEITTEPRQGKLASARIHQGPLRPYALAPCLAWHGFEGPIEVMGLDLLHAARAAMPHDSFVLSTVDIDLIAQAQETLETQVYELNQVRLRWDSTATAHHLDMDGTGSIQQINQTAAGLAAHLIIARNLGGILFLDFLPPATKQARRDITDQVASSLTPLPHRLKVHTMNESGHLILERQRLGPEFSRPYFGPSL